MNKKPNKKINVKYNFNLSEPDNLNMINRNLNELIVKQTEKAIKKLSKIESKYLTDIVADICSDGVIVYFKCNSITILTYCFNIKSTLKITNNFMYIDSVRVIPNNAEWQNTILGIQYEIDVFERGVDNLDYDDKVKFFESMKGDK
jgi:hypothetical protein